MRISLKKSLFKKILFLFIFILIINSVSAATIIDFFSEKFYQFYNKNDGNLITGNVVVNGALTIQKNGIGNINSNVLGMTCDNARCIGDFNQDVFVTLTVTSDQTSTFTGWSTSSITCAPGNSDCSCSGTQSPCFIHFISTPITISANFQNSNAGGGSGGTNNNLKLEIKRGTSTPPTEIAETKECTISNTNLECISNNNWEDLVNTIHSGREVKASFMQSAGDSFIIEKLFIGSNEIKNCVQQTFCAISPSLNNQGLIKAKLVSRSPGSGSTSTIPNLKLEIKKGQNFPLTVVETKDCTISNSNLECVSNGNWETISSEQLPNYEVKASFMQSAGDSFIIEKLFIGSNEIKNCVQQTFCAETPLLPPTNTGKVKVKLLPRSPSGSGGGGATPCNVPADYNCGACGINGVNTCTKKQGITCLGSDQITCATGTGGGNTGGTGIGTGGTGSGTVGSGDCINSLPSDKQNILEGIIKCWEKYTTTCLNVIDPVTNKKCSDKKFGEKNICKRDCRVSIRDCLTKCREDFIEKSRLAGSSGTGSSAGGGSTSGSGSGTGGSGTGTGVTGTGGGNTGAGTSTVELMEAEDATKVRITENNQNDGFRIEHYTFEGATSLKNINENDMFSISYNVPQNGNYELKVRTWRGLSGTPELIVKVNNNEVGRIGIAQTQNGGLGLNFAEYKLNNIALNQGVQNIELKVNSAGSSIQGGFGLFLIDWIKITKIS